MVSVSYASIVLLACCSLHLKEYLMALDTQCVPVLFKFLLVIRVQMSWQRSIVRQNQIYRIYWRWVQPFYMELMQQKWSFIQIYQWEDLIELFLTSHMQASVGRKTRFIWSGGSLLYLLLLFSPPFWKFLLVSGSSRLTWFCCYCQLAIVLLNKLLITFVFLLSYGILHPNIFLQFMDL